MMRPTPREGPKLPRHALHPGPIGSTCAPVLLASTCVWVCPEVGPRVRLTHRANLHAASGPTRLAALLLAAGRTDLASATGWLRPDAAPAVDTEDRATWQRPYSQQQHWGD
eukprot:4880929-Prymnesium_polylepis.1